MCWCMYVIVDVVSVYVLVHVCYSGCCECVCMGVRVHVCMCPLGSGNTSTSSLSSAWYSLLHLKCHFLMLNSQSLI